MKSRNTTANYPGRPSVNISATLIALAIVTVGCTGTQGVQEQEQDPADVYAPSRQEARTLANSLLNTKWKAMSILGKPAGSADSTVEFRADGLSVPAIPGEATRRRVWAPSPISIISGRLRVLSVRSL